MSLFFKFFKLNMDMFYMTKVNALRTEDSDGFPSQMHPSFCEERTFLVLNAHLSFV